MPPLNLPSSQKPIVNQDHTSEDPMSCDIRTFTNTSKHQAGFTSNALNKQDSSTRGIQGPSLIKLTGRQAPPFPSLNIVQSGTQTPTSGGQERQTVVPTGGKMAELKASGVDI